MLDGGLSTQTQYIRPDYYTFRPTGPSAKSLLLETWEMATYTGRITRHSSATVPQKVIINIDDQGTPDPELQIPVLCNLTVPPLQRQIVIPDNDLSPLVKSFLSHSSFHPPQLPILRTLSCLRRHIIKVEETVHAHSLCYFDCLNGRRRH
ncbi:hypothetical protein BDZ91DRAFT_46333 [Kalaharituber pfeilii]|nr:hypothetical protein BDZ91DRAFT_46333 [Kalaharituber pfeilii]